MSTISIIGRGLDPAKHLSLSAIKALQGAEKIVGIESETTFWKELQEKYGIEDVEDVGHLYFNQNRDVDNYNRFINYLHHLSSRFSHLAVLVPGHPRLGVSFIELLKRDAPNHLNIQFVDGISSFDAMTTLLGIDPLEQGTALLDANRMLLFKYVLEPALSYFIYHICSVGNSNTDFLEPSLDNRLDLLKHYLLTYYPKDKKVFLCRIANGLHENSTLLCSTLMELDASQIDFSTTLYLPPEKSTKIDKAFLKLLR
jgi:uncharacterized protein YabN with tetrapyrrole methylase and pyrophosphatase domain